MPCMLSYPSRIPKGTIKQWKDLIANIPLGWQICDGTNSTPDLRSKFTRGAPAGNNSGGTGGADTVTLDNTMIPSHTHSVTDPQHNHGVDGQSADLDQSGVAHSGAKTNTNTTGSNTATITVNTQGGGGSHENRPAFYEVIYIMKVIDQ